MKKIAILLMFSTLNGCSYFKTSTDKSVPPPLTTVQVPEVQKVQTKKLDQTSTLPPNNNQAPIVSKLPQPQAVTSLPSPNYSGYYEGVYYINGKAQNNGPGSGQPIFKHPGQASKNNAKKRSSLFNFGKKK